MSKFESGLRAARQKQLVTYGVMALVALFAVTALFGTLVFSSGTAVEIRPDDARLTGSVRLVSGFGLTAGGVVYTFSDQPQIEVSAPGFFTLERVIGAGEKGSVVTVHLAEKPGEIQATTTPSFDDTRWFVDGRLVVVGSQLQHPLEPGHYQLGIDQPFHTIQEMAFQISRAESTEVSVRLVRVQGSLTIEATPGDSDVTIDSTDSVDGVREGKTPLNMPLAGGEYEITVARAGFEPVRETVRVTSQKPGIDRHYRLQPLQARLSFSVHPPGGELLVNGKKIDPSTSLSVPVGAQNVITYSRPGFYSRTEKVTLQTGDQREVSLGLTPELGRVRVEARPQANVLVDGVMVGQTPLVLELPAVPASISLRQQGYRTVTRTVTPTGKGETKISEVLRPEAEARLAEAPRTYQTPVGSTMMLFQPSSFTMGAPRHEQGQRANEFLRRIDLTRPFYAGLHEITLGQFRRFRPAHAATSASSEPVTSVSWTDAAQFCNWLSMQENLVPFYVFGASGYAGINDNGNADGYRLLTEAEWEWLARRAAKKQQTMFTWGNETVIPPRAGNIADESARGGVQFYVPNYTDGHPALAPVGSYPAEPSGLYDQTGNVSEWVHDFYSLQPPSASGTETDTPTDPLGPAYGDVHVIKGSSWQSGTRTTLRPAYREGSVNGGEAVGFRIARYLSGRHEIEE